MIPSGLEAFALDTTLAGFILPEQVESDAVDQGEVPGCMTGSFAALIFSKPHVQYLMQFVFDVPVLADGAFPPSPKIPSGRFGLSAVGSPAMSLCCKFKQHNSGYHALK